MVYAQNIDSGQSNSQLGTRSSGSCRNLVYLRIRGAILADCRERADVSWRMTAAVKRTPARIAFISFAPDVSDALVSDRRVNNRVRDRAMTHEGLQCPRIDSASRQGVASRMPQHVSMDRKW